MNGAKAKSLRTPERPNPGRKQGGSAKVGVKREPNYSPSYADRKAAMSSVTGRLNRERIEQAAKDIAAKLTKRRKRTVEKEDK